MLVSSCHAHPVVAKYAGGFVLKAFLGDPACVGVASKTFD